MNECKREDENAWYVMKFNDEIPVKMENCFPRSYFHILHDTVTWCYIYV